MNWHDHAWRLLVAAPVGGYGLDDRSTEPTALACLALAAAVQCGQPDRCETVSWLQATHAAADWLSELQLESGAVPVRPGLQEPAWTTSLALAAWLAVDAIRFRREIDAAIAWTLQAAGKPQPRHPSFGHDPTIPGWPWVSGTHGWVEPTALHAWSLKRAGRQDHPRVREAVRLLHDRQLPGGGWNYGNTTVLGQTLLAHVQPTGIALLGLWGETGPAATTAVRRATAQLRRAIDERATTCSLAWAAIGLAAHGASFAPIDDLLERRAAADDSRPRSTHHWALLALAGLASTTDLFRKWNITGAVAT